MISNSVPTHSNFAALYALLFYRLSSGTCSLGDSPAHSTSGNMSSLCTDVPMRTPFDLLRRDPDGSFIWLEAATDLAQARTRLRELASCSPGDYVLFDHTCQETVEKLSSQTAAGSR